MSKDVRIRDIFLSQKGSASKKVWERLVLGISTFKQTYNLSTAQNINTVRGTNLTVQSTKALQGQRTVCTFRNCERLYAT
jgi:hypothetical protein